MKTKKLILCSVSTLLVMASVLFLNTQTTNAEINYNETARFNGNSKESNEEKTEDECNESSIDNPIKVGKRGQALKKFTFAKNRISYKTVDVTLENIFTGTEASEIVRKYNSDNSINKIPALTSNLMEYVVIDYSISLPSELNTSKDGQHSLLGIKITNLDGSNIVDSETNHFIRVNNIDITENLNCGETGTSRVVFTIPKSVSQFIIRLGDSNELSAYYKINK